MRKPTLCFLFPALLYGAGAAAQQQINLPDNQHLSKSTSQLGGVGSALWWRTSSGRFQILYEASHFVGKAGVSGQILITKLEFRGEDGEINLGGQVYSGVTVEVGSTSLTSASFTPTFSANRAPTAPNTTTMGLLGTTNVAVAPSVGSVPNNWNIELDLLAMGNAFLFDPTSAEPNLLIDVSMPNAPANAPPLAMVFMQNTTGTNIRGAGCTTATPGAGSGTLSTIPMVVGLEFLGTGGHNPLVPARNEFFGGACGGAASSFYQGFLNGDTWDIGTGIVLTPDNPGAPNYYFVTPGSTPPDLTQVNASANSTADDALVPFPLGFVHRYPGGSTTDIIASTNGFVWLDPAMTDSQFAAVIGRLLGDGVPGFTTHSGARYALYWHDLNGSRNLGINPQAGLHVKTDTTGGPGNAVCFITWWDVGEFNTVFGAGIQGHTVWTFQCVINEASGIVEFRYGNMPPFTASSTTTVGSHAAMLGFSPGRIGGAAGVNSVDPQSRDLSLELPFATQIEGVRGHMGQTATAAPNAGGVQYGGRMYGGQTVTWGATNVPPGSLLGVQLVDFTALRPGLQFPPITAPGCMLSMSINAILWEGFVAPAGTVTGTIPLVVPHGFEGFDLYAQFIVLDGIFGAPNLITVASNSIRHTLGLN